MTSIAKTIKEKTGGHSLVGYFYGYLFEHAWNDVWPQQGGHLGLSKLLDSPYIDFYGCSYSYNMFNRKFGLSADFISPHDSALLNGKTVFLEEETRPIRLAQAWSNPLTPLRLYKSFARSVTPPGPRFSAHSQNPPWARIGG